MHNAALAALGLNWVYVPFTVRPEDVPAAVAGLRALGMVGVNVTVPLKEAVLPYLDTLSDEARRIGAVNTIVNQNGVLHGDSTDGAGFLRDLAAQGQTNFTGRHALLLGAGGSARAVAFALAAQGCCVLISSRTASRAQAVADSVNGHFPGAARVMGATDAIGPPDFLVNATPLGMAPHESELPPLPPDALAGRPFVYDLIYNPAETRLLAQARAAGCQSANGLGMLAQQGALSLSLWTGLPLAQMPLSEMARAAQGTLPERGTTSPQKPV